MRILGCDPGLHGCLALWDTDAKSLVLRDAPTAEIAVGKSKKRLVCNQPEYARMFRELEPDKIIIEQVNGLPGQSAPAAFNFGRGAGLLDGFAYMLGLPVYYVTPMEWQRALRVPSGKDGSRLRASQLFPQYAQHFARVKDDGRSDSALLALYGASL